MRLQMRLRLRPQQLPYLRHQKNKQAASAPNAQLVKDHGAAQEEEEEMKKNADDHYTQHGCHCQGSWEYQGATYKACSKTPGASHAGHAWCKIIPGCLEKLTGTEEGDWDLCTQDDGIDHHHTEHGCHCAPVWFWKGDRYEGCNKTSLGPSWCYLYENGILCHGAQRTEHSGQHWDYCAMEFEQHAAESHQPVLPETGHKDPLAVNYSRALNATDPSDDGGASKHEFWHVWAIWLLLILLITVSCILIKVFRDEKS